MRRQVKIPSDFTDTDRPPRWALAETQKAVLRNRDANRMPVCLGVDRIPLVDDLEIKSPSTNDTTHGPYVLDKGSAMQCTQSLGAETQPTTYAGRPGEIYPLGTALQNVSISGR